MSRSEPCRVGIGGPVGAGKTTLLEQLCRALHPEYSVAVVTNDIFTREDAEFLVRFRERFVEPRAVLVAAILERGVEAGELRGDIDVGATVAVLHGAFWYPMLLGEVLDDDRAKTLVDIVLRGVAR